MMEMPKLFLASSADHSHSADQFSKRQQHLALFPPCVPTVFRISPVSFCHRKSKIVQSSRDRVTAEQPPRLPESGYSTSKSAADGWHGIYKMADSMEILEVP